MQISAVWTRPETEFHDILIMIFDLRGRRRNTKIMIFDVVLMVEVKTIKILKIDVPRFLTMENPNLKFILKVYLKVYFGSLSKLSTFNQIEFGVLGFIY